MDRVIEDGLLVEGAIVSSYSTPHRQPNNVDNVTVELKANIDGSIHDEVHFFYVIDSLVNDASFASLSWLKKFQNLHHELFVNQHVPIVEGSGFRLKYFAILFQVKRDLKVRIINAEVLYEVVE